MLDNIISMTRRKFFGSYYHSLIKHSPEQYIILSGRLANTEKKEATFNFIKAVTNLISNHHPSNIIANAIIRMQVKNILNERLHHESKESALNEAYQSIKSTLKNTVIPYIWIKNTNISTNAYLSLKLTTFWTTRIGGKKLIMELNFLILAMLLNQQCSLHTFD